MANNVIVNVPNSISKSRRALKIDEERVLYLSLSRLNLDSATDYADENERTVKVSLKEIRELYGGRSYKTRLRDTCKNLEGKVIEVYVSAGKWKRRVVFSGFEFDDEAGFLGITYNKDIMPYLNAISQGYTKFILQDVFVLSSQYAVRLLELMMQYRNWTQHRQGNKIYRDISISDLRGYLGLDGIYTGEKKKYERLCDFRRYCLIKPIDEINKKTGYKMSYEEIKSGRVTSSIRFCLEIVDEKAYFEEHDKICSPKREQLNLFDTSSEISPTAQMLVDKGVAPAIAKSLVEEYGEKCCKEKVYMAEQKRDAGPGWLVSAIKQDWQLSSSGSHQIIGDDTLDKLYELGFGNMAANILVSIVAKHERFGVTERSWCEKSNVNPDVLYEAISKGDFSALESDKLFTIEIAPEGCETAYEAGKDKNGIVASQEDINRPQNASEGEDNNELEEMVQLIQMKQQLGGRLAANLQDRLNELIEKFG